MLGNHAILIKDKEQAFLAMQEIGVSEAGMEYMIPKAIFHCIKLKNISCKAANIIKQEMLSRGGEAALNWKSLYAQEKTDVILMATLRQYELLIAKLAQQPLGLSQVAEEIKHIINNLNQSEYQVPLPSGQSLQLGKKTCVMGILNVTPDSFSDGGNYIDPGKAVEHALEMQAAGADIIDIGGASSRPGTVIADGAEEWQRICPVIERLSQEKIILSVDTFRAEVARQALDKGVHIINDIGRLQMDPDLLGVLVEKQAPVILMHNRMQMQSGQPYDDLMAEICAELKESINQALEAGLASAKIIVDPGVGFGKTPAQNRLIIQRLEELKSLGYPILLGTSRKSFINDTMPSTAQERLEASLATVAMGIMNGAHIVRVHDVEATKKVAMMVDAVRNENG